MRVPVRAVWSLATLLVAASPLAAQFSSDVPGIPRASIPFRGSHQNRTNWTFTGFKVPGGSGDTVGGGLRFGFGRSYRVQTRFEVGFDLTLLDGMAVKPPTDDTNIVGAGGTYIRAEALYGIRIGAKFRPFSALDPDGYGWEAAVGAAIQPGLRPLYGVERYADSTRTGGQFTSKDADLGLYGADPLARLHTATTLAGMVSYRSRRLLFDGGLMVEKASDPAAGDQPSPTVAYDKLSPRLGGMFRLTPSFALGGAFWGKGSPAWSDEVWIGMPGELKQEQFGLLLSFGSQPEAGTDLMISSPTGKFGQSLRLLIRTRSTR